MLSVRGLSAARWVDRVLQPTYEPHGWRLQGGRVEPRRCEMPPRWAERTRAPPLALPGPESGPGGRWSETVFAGMGAMPSGLAVEWDVQPLGLAEHPIELLPPTILQPVPLGYRPVPASASERQVMDDSISHRWQAQWGVVGRLTAGAGADLQGMEELDRLVQSASHVPGRAGIRFRRRRAWLPGRPAQFRISEAELRAFFPSPWSFTAFRPQEEGAAPVHRLRLRPPATDPAIAIDAQQGRHLLVLGETGMGKSTLLIELARRAMRWGSVVLFDPIGDTTRRLVGSMTPAERARAVLISPIHSPVGINAVPVHGREGRGNAASAERAREDLVGALRRVRESRYEGSPFWGPRLEETATIAIDAASRFPGGTLLDAQHLLEAIGHRPGPVPPEARESVEALRRRVMERPEEVDGTRRLLGEITRHSLLRRMLCEPNPRWSVADALAPNRTVLLAGEAPEAGEGVARSLLSVHLAILWAELIARPRPSKVFLVLDEVQWYAHESLGEMLRLGRRFNLHVWAATQSLSRLPLPLRDALLTNSADVVLFRGSPEEAREFARWSSLIKAEEIGALPRGRALVFVDKGRELSWLDGDRGVESSAPDPESWEEVVERSEAWVVPQAVPVPSDHPIGGDGPAPPGAADPLRDLILILWAGLLAVEPAPTLRISLTGLRRVADPAGQRVRELGRRLADAGVRMDTGRDDSGSFWIVAREGFRTLLSSGVDPAELVRAAERWRSIGERDSARPAQKAH
ncbi:MAG: DUF87 domain-containing protein [Thermoplasmata archaeon]|nr:DUF87 domain-containing protein [Thermoplasmata archaeon]